MPNPKWDEKYRADASPYLRPIAFVEQAASSLAPGRALDIACGPGRHALLLARLGWSVDAVDASTVACEMVRAANESNVQVFEADLETDEFAIQPAAYDLIVVCCYLQRNLFPAIRDGIRPGGHVLMVIPMVDDRPGVKTMNRDFLLAGGELRGFFEDWEVISYFEGIPSDAHRRQAQLLALRPRSEHPMQHGNSR